MADFEHDVPVVMRGYDREAVEDALRDLRRELLNLSAQNAQLATELRDTNNRLLEAEGQLEESSNPSYAGVGAKAALILSTSEEQAKRLVLEAETEAQNTRRSIDEEVKQKRQEAQEYYDSLVAEAQRRADRIINSATVEFETSISDSKNRAAEIVDEAIREAGCTPVQRNSFYEPVKVWESAPATAEAEPPSGKSKVLEDNLATA